VVHLVAVVFATAAVALLSAPVAWHRVLFRRHHGVHRDPVRD
jgi:hypothetical protein